MAMEQPSGAAATRTELVRRALVVATMAFGAVAICLFVTGVDSSSFTGEGEVVLATDCSVDPGAASCRRPSFMDMINGIGHRASLNAIRQKRVKEALLKQEQKANMQLLAEQAKKKQAEEAAKGGSDDDSKGKSGGEKLEGSAVNLKSTVYQGLDIGSKKAVDDQMAKLLKTGGAAAVEKKVAQIREQILSDSGKMFGFGKKAGYLPAPPLKAFN